MKESFNSLVLYIKKHPKVDFTLLALGLATFLIIALINAPRASIWFDEAFSAYLIQFSYFDIARFTATDVHPPFYYWLLKTWSLFFGTSDLALRSLSVVLGASAITAAFFLMRKLFTRGVASVALLFMVLSPMFIRYSDEARMYTLATLIVFLATHVLLKAIATNKRSHWVWYGVLVSLGMWTHYFTALAWLAHWVWWGIYRHKKGASLKANAKAFFTKEWTLSYALAVILYLPWLPFMVKQLGIVQGFGFWIGPVSPNTITNYLSNYFYYLSASDVLGWLAFALIAVTGLVIALLPRVYQALSKTQKKSFALIASLAWVPPVLLFLASMPPLRPSFVDRYLIPSVLALSLFLAVVLVVGTKKWKPFWRILPVVVIIAMMSFGVSNVYKYGNYNKNSGAHTVTRQVVEAARASSDGAIPIVANSPWIFYEAVQYETDTHPVYFIDENTQYQFGSLDMLKNTDLNKITDLDAFTEENEYLWYLGVTDDADIAAYEDDWVKIETVTVYDELTDTARYKATLYKVN